MKKVLIIEPGSISVADKKNLEKNGILIIEHKEPDKVRELSFTTKIYTHDLMMSALKSVQSYNSEAFVKELYKRLSEKESGKTGANAQDGKKNADPLT